VGQLHAHGHPGDLLDGLLSPGRAAHWLAGLFARKPLRVLFVGNSLTYYRAPGPGAAPVLNDLPGLLARMSASRGERRPLRAARVSEDGASLEDHLRGSLLEGALRAGAWDYVVLQESSERVRARPAALRRDARLLDARIRAAGARSALFSTWSESGRPQAAARCGRACAEAAGELGVPLVPVAQAWRLAAARSPQPALRMRDGLHPGPDGAYLSACVFYAWLYGDSLQACGAAALADDERAVAELRAAHGLPPAGSALGPLRAIAREAVLGARAQGRRA